MPSFNSEGQVQGRLEVKVGDDWSTFLHAPSYNINFKEEEATVACRQLGNKLGYTLVSAGKVDSVNTDDGTGPGCYYASCAGTESTLDSCATFQDVYAEENDHWYDIGVSCTVLAPGDECEECVAGKFSDTTGVAACASCAAGSYSTVGAESCEQVRVEGG
jgi:hypothetical protein